MKQAILIVCGEEYERLPFLVEQFDERFNVYIHIDKKSYSASKTCRRLESKDRHKMDESIVYYKLGQYESCKCNLVIV